MLFIPDYRLRRKYAPAKVRMTEGCMGLHDWEVVLGNGQTVNFGMAMPDFIDSSGRNRRNPHSEYHRREAKRFARWINSPPGVIERIVTWWRTRRCGTGR